ncbi:hypothetical protein P154DRAFT_539165 [Amniculicola lignicola CBS 123094]|uniref:Uncharacterized protein n=1 Tax=Amniculicola lignicola CBS 123094 TaxID=1392246 RepID=A0A6A5W0T0_9PLEO|nr:hypothetical protein P154DRAFT_539165 [Amniculicola lignicola CBS 123094]
MDDHLEALPTTEVWQLFSTARDNTVKAYDSLRKAAPRNESHDLSNTQLSPRELRDISYTIRTKGYNIISQGTSTQVGKPNDFSVDHIHATMEWIGLTADQFRRHRREHGDQSDPDHPIGPPPDELVGEFTKTLLELKTAVEWYVSQLQRSALEWDGARDMYYYYDYKSKVFVYQDGSFAADVSKRTNQDGAMAEEH